MSNKHASGQFKPLTQPIPLTEQSWPDGTIPLVSIRTMTFNHEEYIVDCLEGALMQKTTFPVQYLIHDDASTDLTGEILKEYAEKYPNVIRVYSQSKNTFRSSNKHQLRKAYFDLINGYIIS